MPANCGCGAGGDVSAKHVVLMSVCTGHNSHRQYSYPARITHLHMKRCCLINIKSIWIILQNQTECLTLRFHYFHLLCVTQRMWASARVLTLPRSCWKCPSPLMSSVQIHVIISFLRGVHLTCDTIYVKLLCSCSKSNSDRACMCEELYQDSLSKSKTSLVYTLVMEKLGSV